MSLKLSDLKKLHEKGFALIYLRPKTKRPFEMNWTTVKPKTWEELENSFEKSYNIGVRLGEPSKLISGNFLGAIDCDVKEYTRKAKKEMNDALRALGLNLETTPTVLSGRGNGSKHLYVQTKEPMRAMKFAQSTYKVKVKMPGEGNKPHSKSELSQLTPREREEGYRIRYAWEISFLGTGQQTVLPPSIHPDTGFAYDWASPLTVKHLPLFKPEKFTPGKNSSYVKNERNKNNGCVDFKAEEVDLWKTKLSVSLIKIIETGEGCEDRSNALFSVALAMCRLKFTDNQILSVLSDKSNYIAGAAYDHTRSDSRARAVVWLHKYTLLKARHETDVRRRFENLPKLKRLTPKQAETQVNQLILERDEQLPDLKGNGKPHATLRNVVHVLEKFMGGKLVQFNEFNNRPYFATNTVYGGIQGHEIADHHDLELKHYIACHYGFEPSKDLCFEAHSLVARKYAFHPVRAYLSSLTWDGVERLDHWLIDALSASGPQEYVAAVGRKVLVAAVTRVFEPGCKFDYVMVLEGHQGKGKSTALQILGSAPWFTDGLGDIHSKDVVDQMTGKWIIELSELASIRKAESEAVKSFLSRQVDRVRMSYGRRSEDYHRQSIFVGSTNSSEYFNDETGNRRYWPIKIEEINREWLRVNRDQLWAEAVERYNLGEEIYLTKELEEVATAEQEKRFDVDEWESEIKKIIKKAEAKKETIFTSTELWRAIHLNDGGGHPPRMDTLRIAKIMRRLGYVRKVARIKGDNTKCWRKQRV